MQEKNLELLRKLDKFFKEMESDKPNPLLDKFGRAIEDIEKDIAILKVNSHPAQEYICCRKCGCKISKTKTKK